MTGRGFTGRGLQAEVAPEGVDREGVEGEVDREGLTGKGSQGGVCRGTAGCVNWHVLWEVLGTSRGEGAWPI